MNKYDEKVFEVIPGGGTIYELLCRPDRSRSFQFLNILFDNIPWAVDGFSSKGAYYLHVNDIENKATLLHIDQNLTVLQNNVTVPVQQSANKKSFVFENNKYKLYRKLQ